LNAPALVEDFFRHVYGKLVATLSRRVGTQFFDDVEDAAQSALMKALQTWPSVPVCLTLYLYSSGRAWARPTSCCVSTP